MIGRGSATDPLLAVLLDISVMESNEGEVQEAARMEPRRDAGIGNRAWRIGLSQAWGTS